jgi:hypothetical protein
MFWIAAATLAVSAPQPSRPAPVVAQTTATVRIVSGVRLSFNSPSNPGAPPAHDSRVTTDGKVQPARLIEFE